MAKFTLEADYRVMVTVECPDSMSVQGAADICERQVSIFTFSSKDERCIYQKGRVRIILDDFSILKYFEEDDFGNEDEDLESE